MALTEKNYLYLVVSIVVVFIGLLLMIGGGSDDPTQFNEAELFSFRRITLAPIVIVGGFVFGIYAILKRPKTDK
ncbi:MAG: DUF3098 domain-containing protein [Rikenellaceae bacterium]